MTCWRDEEYYQMPALFEVQDYMKCLSQRENVFCAGTFELSSPAPSRLYDIITKYSANKKYNFNHTRLHRAVCLGPKSKCPVEGNLTESFEGCIDRSTFEEYGLRARLMRFDFCRKPGEKLEIDGLTIAFCIYLTIVVILNVAGTVYDYALKDANARGNRWLMAFSLIDNWNRLTSTSEGKDPRLQNLNCFYGIKTISMIIVQLSHVTAMLTLSYPTNSRLIETEMHRLAGKFLMHEGNIVIQTFVFVANFLTGYKMLLYAEKYKMKLSLLPKLIIDRFVRFDGIFHCLR